MRPLLKISDAVYRAVRVLSIIARDQQYNEEEDDILLHLVSVYLALCSDRDRFFVICCNLVEPRSPEGLHVSWNILDDTRRLVNSSPRILASCNRAQFDNAGRVSE